MNAPDEVLLKGILLQWEAYASAERWRTHGGLFK